MACRDGGRSSTTEGTAPFGELTTNMACKNGGGASTTEGTAPSGELTTNMARRDGGRASTTEGTSAPKKLITNMACRNGGGVSKTEGTASPKKLITNMDCRDGGGVSKTEGKSGPKKLITDMAHGDWGGVSTLEGTVSPKKLTANMNCRDGGGVSTMEGIVFSGGEATNMDSSFVGNKSGPTLEESSSEQNIINKVDVIKECYTGDLTIQETQFREELQPSNSYDSIGIVKGSYQDPDLPFLSNASSVYDIPSHQAANILQESLNTRWKHQSSRAFITSEVNSEKCKVPLDSRESTIPTSTVQPPKNSSSFANKCTHTKLSNLN
eukprot:5870-Ditylum_brightwellii.AAC.1